MNIDYTKGFIRGLKKLSKKDKSLRQDVVDKINLFISNRSHPSLRLHKLQGQLKDAWSISIDKSTRIIFNSEKDEITFTNIGSHDEVYR